MNPAANQRIAPGRVLLIMAVLLGVWLAFEFYPRKRPVPPLPPVAAESKLNAVGLENNPDWDGLPEMFAVWADRIDWAGDETEFAYWDPVTRAYSYIFRASRAGGKYRFRLVTIEHRRSLDSDPVAQSETHPFVFLVDKIRTSREPAGPLLAPSSIATATDLPKADVKIPPAHLEAPKQLELEEKIDGTKK